MCQKLSNLMEVWWSFDNNKFGHFLDLPVHVCILHKACLQLICCRSGFVVCFDFITGLKHNVVAVRLCTGLRDGANVYYQPSVLPAVYTSNQSYAVLGMRQPIERSVTVFESRPSNCVCLFLWADEVFAGWCMSQVRSY